MEELVRKAADAVILPKQIEGVDKNNDATEM